MVVYTQDRTNHQVENDDTGIITVFFANATKSL